MLIQYASYKTIYLLVLHVNNTVSRTQETNLLVAV